MSLDAGRAGPGLRGKPRAAAAASGAAAAAAAVRGGRAAALCLVQLDVDHELKLPRMSILAAVDL